MNKLVVFDIDGVVADFERKLVKTLAEEFAGDDMLSNRDRFKLEDRYAGEMLRRAKQLTADPNFYYDVSSIPGAFSFVSELMDNGFAVMFYSSRPVFMNNVTRRWLHKEFGSYFESSFGVFVGVQDKSYFLSELTGSTIEFVVEDNPEEIQTLKSNGFTVLTWENPWNEGIFPRLYLRKDGELMFWVASYIEAEPFWKVMESP
jgi:5'(3')-deoxyribonucleotidase